MSISLCSLYYEPVTSNTFTSAAAVAAAYLIMNTVTGGERYTVLTIACLFVNSVTLWVDFSGNLGICR